jgi:hypothetical protein
MTGWNRPAPGEQEAGGRSWEVVRDAFDERIPVQRRRDWRPLAVVLVGVAILAAAFSPPGLAVLGSLRKAVRGERNAKSALFALPAHGRLLVGSQRGIWVVERDGSKRLLSGYRDASWSPHGKFVAAVHGNELRAFERNGTVHWSIGRPGRIRNPTWSFDGFRIAYFAGSTLRVINGDGTGDRLLTRTTRSGLARWQPSSHSLAYVNEAGNIQVVNVDSPKRFAVIHTRLPLRGLDWAPDGHSLLTFGPHVVAIFGARGGQFRRLDRGRASVVTASISPNGKSVAFVETEKGQSSLQLTGVTTGPTRQIFKGAGLFTNAIWAPNGRWVLLDWATADQWLFIRSPAVKKIVPISNIDANFGNGAMLAGWCCP